jgi:hypothetical protein
MMQKPKIMEQFRLLIKDINGNIFRLFKIGANIDKFGEKYIKLCFPDLHNVNMRFFRKPGGIDKSDLIKGTFIPSFEDSSLGLEYTFHISNTKIISQFKDTREKRYPLKQLRSSVPEIAELLSIDLYDLSFFKSFSKKLTSTDILLDHPFQYATRFRIIKMPNTRNYKMKFDNSLGVEIRYFHYIDIKNIKSFILIIEEELKNIPLHAKGVAIFKHDIEYVDKSFIEHTKESFEKL